MAGFPVQRVYPGQSMQPGGNVGGGPVAPRVYNPPLNASTIAGIQSGSTQGAPGGGGGGGNLGALAGLPGGSPGNAPNSTGTDWSQLTGADGGYPSANGATGMMFSGPPSIEGENLYNQANNFANSSQQWGNYGGSLFGGPSGQAVGQSVGNLGASANGALAYNGTNLDALNQNQAGAYNNSTGQLAAYGGLSGLQGYAGGKGYGQAQNAQALGYLGSAAAGNQPSQAQILMGQGLNQAQAQARAAAASTRGNFGLANANKIAAGQGTQLAQNVTTAAGAQRAAEMAQAQQAYAGATQNAAGLGAQASGQYAQGLQSLAALQQQYAQGYGQQAGQLSGQQLAAQQAYNGAASGLLGSQLGYVSAQQGAQSNLAQLYGNLATAQGNIDINQMGQATQQAIANQSFMGQLAGAGASAGGALLAAML